MWWSPLRLGLVAMAAMAAWIGNPCGSAAGAPGETRMVAEASGSGIEGRVSIRPVRPVERKGTSNSRAYQAKITVLDATGREVTVVESDADGRFRVLLPPGTYVLRPESPGPYPRASEQKVIVRPTEMTEVTVVYDSGMR